MGMIQNDLQQFAKIMTVLGELYSKPITETLVEIYWRILQKYSIQSIQGAVNVYLNHEEEGRFMPKPADIIRHINEVHKKNAWDAWSKVESAVRHVGRYSCVAFDDPLIHYVIIKMGGWSKMCSHSISHIPTVANEFIENYTLHTKETPHDYPKYLRGINGATKIIKIGKDNN